MNLRYDMIVCYVFRQREAHEEWETLRLRRSPGRYMQDTWQFVSGGIEGDETAPTAALRELREETGLVPREFFHGGHVEPFYVHPTDTLWFRPAFVAIVAADVEVMLNEEHTAFRWEPIATLEPMWTGERDALAIIQRQVLQDSPAKEHLRIALPDEARG